jgi:hypothetical protein
VVATRSSMARLVWKRAIFALVEIPVGARRQQRAA